MKPPGFEVVPVGPERSDVFLFGVRIAANVSDEVGIAIAAMISLSVTKQAQSWMYKAPN